MANILVPSSRSLRYSNDWYRKGCWLNLDRTRSRGQKIETLIGQVKPGGLGEQSRKEKEKETEKKRANRWVKWKYTSKTFRNILLKCQPVQIRFSFTSNNACEMHYSEKTISPKTICMVTTLPVAEGKKNSDVDVLQVNENESSS